MASSKYKTLIAAVCLTLLLASLFILKGVISEYPLVMPSLQVSGVPCLLEAQEKAEIEIVGAHCFKTSFQKWPTVELLNMPDNQGKIKVKLQKHEGKHVSFRFQGDGKATLRVYDSNGLEIASALGAPSNGVNRSAEYFSLEIPPKIEGFQIEMLGTLGFGNIRDLEIKDALVKEIKHSTTKDSSHDSMYIYFSLIAVIFFLLFIVLKIFPNMSSLNYLSLTLIFTLLTIHSGSPFSSGEGVFDPFDDAAYFSWAHTLGFQKTVNIVSAVKTTSAMDNIHSWGTGLFFAPATFFNQYYGIDLSNNGYNLTTYSLVNSISIFYGFLSVLIFFAAFRLVVSSNIALWMSLLTIVASSMIKWTFYRNFFSHTPEAFTLACFTFCFLKIYARQNKSLPYLLLLSLVIIMIPQVRRENLLFCLLPIAYEFLQRTSWERFLKRTLCIFSSIILGVALLQYTNLWTKNPSFWVNPTGYLLNFKDLFKTIYSNFHPVFIDKNTGFFSIYTVFPFFAIYGAYASKIKISNLVPILFLIVGYFSLCLIHLSPTGAEWQNRFLLKLNPLIFGGAGIALMSMRARAMALSILAMTIAAWYQFSRYLENLPEEFPRFVDLLTDLQIQGAFASALRKPLSPYATYSIYFLIMISSILTVKSLFNILIFKLSLRSSDVKRKQQSKTELKSVDYMSIK